LYLIASQHNNQTSVTSESKPTEVSDHCRVLSLDGGGAKGFYTLGVLKELDPGRRSQSRFAGGYYLSGFQPLNLERRVEFVSPSFYPQWLSAERKQAHSKASRAAMLQRRRQPL
jgi:hypothetical protein